MTDKKLISSLQGLRAVAFLCVVISHCGAPWLGPWAISVFVALSGFLMVCNYYDRPRTAPGLQSAIAFSFKKIRRLYPLHLIMMAAAPVSYTHLDVYKRQIIIVQWTSFIASVLT